MRWSVRCRMHCWLHKDNLITDCDCGDSQADPPFVSVTLGKISGMKSKFRKCSFLKTQFDSKEIDCFLCPVRIFGRPLYISECNRHCLQRFVVNVSSVFQ
jgi:hypothetical protein